MMSEDTGQTVEEIRQELGIEPTTGIITGGDIIYGPNWPKDPFEWSIRCSYDVPVDEVYEDE